MAGSRGFLRWGACEVVIAFRGRTPPVDASDQWPQAQPLVPKPTKLTR